MSLTRLSPSKRHQPGFAPAFKAIDKVVFTERGCVEDQPQHPKTARVLRLVPLAPPTAALRARLCQWLCRLSQKTNVGFTIRSAWVASPTNCSVVLS